MNVGDAATAVADAVRGRSDEIETARTLPPDVVDTIVAHGLFKLCVPTAFGGAESDPLTLLEAIEVVSAVDASVGWCVMIGATTGLSAGWLPAGDAEEIYGPPGSVTGGMLAPRGTATPTDGGYHLRGHWAFGSGSPHCTWIGGGALVDGTGENRFCLVPAADVAIADTWHVVGLRGTGSNDYSIDAFVPEARAVAFGRPPTAAGALYRMPLFGLLAACIGAVSLGIAAAALDDLVDLAGGKVATGHRRRLAERAAVQADVGKAASALRAGRALLHEVVGDTWAEAEAGDAASIELRAALRGAATHAATTAAAVTATAYTLGGGTSIYADHPLQRHFRDAHVATQHMMVAPPTWELAGRARLGLEVDPREV